MILNCQKCLKYRNNNKKEKIIQHDIPKLPWSKVGSDICEFQGKYYASVINYFSKFIENSVIPNKTAFSIIKFIKIIFTRHGIPSDLVAENNLYNSSEFLKFSKEYGFNFIPSSPTYPQSNGLSEMDVKIMKRILKKCDNPKLGLLKYINMPLTGMDYSPTQLLMSRRTMLPVHHDLLIPSNPYNQITESRDMQNIYYDRNTSELPNLLANNTARMKKDGIWKKVRVQEKLTLPRSYNVVDKYGRLYRRNCKHLIKTNEQPFVYQQKQLGLPNESPINNAVPTTSNETTADNEIIKTTIPEAVSPEPQAEVRRSLKQDRLI